MKSGGKLEELEWAVGAGGLYGALQARGGEYYMEEMKLLWRSRTVENCFGLNSIASAGE